MRRKRLNHSVNQFWQQFIGWQLMWSYRQLVAHGDGVLVIDVLNGTATKDGRDINDLSIVRVLHDWLQEELARLAIEPSSIERAVLEVRLQFGLAPWGEGLLAGQLFATDGVPVVTDRVQVCHMTGIGSIKTAERLYRGPFTETLAWPEGWGAA